MKNVKGMLSRPVTMARYGPIQLGTAAITLAAIASTIFVPDRMPTKMPAAKISDTTGSTFAACAVSRSFWSCSFG